MELKLELIGLGDSRVEGLNRTFMELKLGKKGGEE